MIGHCSKCGKIWTLETKEGICPWCGQQAYCQTTTTLPQLPKSSSRQSQWQPAINHSYDQLEGKWLTYYKVAVKFLGKVTWQYKDDLLHAIMLNLALADRNGDKPDSTSWMYTIAKVTVINFIYDWVSSVKGNRCNQCSPKQRKQCQEQGFSGVKCPKGSSSKAWTGK